MQEEVEQRTVTLAVNTSKMTANVLKSAISKYLAYRKEKKREGPVKPRGKQSVKQLVGQNQGVSNIEIADFSTLAVILEVLTANVTVRCSTSSCNRHTSFLE